MIAAVGAVLIALAPIAQPETVEPTTVAIRGQARPVEGTGASATPEGLTLTLADGTTVVLGWHLVRGVDGAGEDQARAFADVAERAWRAGARLERGDAYAAETLYEELFTTYRELTGPTAVVISEGLLQCRLRRGSQVQAVEAWTSALRAGALDAGPLPPGVSAPLMSGGELLDPVSGLCPALPPMWTGGPALRVLIDQPAPPAGEADAAVMANWLLALYVHAARFESGDAGSSLPEPPPGLEGHPALWIIRARTGNAEVRASARRVIEDALQTTDRVWLEAWYRAALGRSLILEPDRESRLLGVAHLLQIPARLAVTQPYLAGLCIAEASATLADMGDAPAADRLREELIRSYPDHPSIDWQGLRRAGAAAPEASGSLARGSRSP